MSAKPQQKPQPVSIDQASVPDVTLQPASEDIWDKKYRLKDKNGNAVDANVADTYKRVAKALSEVEDEDKREFWSNRFTWALANGAIPAGRIMSNAGAQAHKPATSTINCTVSGVIPDSMDGILTMVKEAGLTLKAGCGIGYEFSTLRPKGAYVSGAGAYTSGPLSFMDIYDKMCFTVSSAGGRRGAQMGTFDISHPDVADFIKAKREDGRLRQFNLSCLITRDFMQAVKNDEDWDLVFPATKDELANDDMRIIFKQVANPPEKAKKDDRGFTACRVYKTIKARRLWDVIMSSTYDYAEPGFILIDEVNDLNNNWFCEDIRATNPCGEQPLPPYGACLLGSVNLTKFVKDAFTENAYFDWDMYREVVSVFTRMLDNVVDINGLPLEQQRQAILDKRRHG
ncbi:MAG TPA: ribonucleoside-diphosphate reductase, adenosylcobalamin-dependent, partial [Mariprofundaceae bacterium]|nr:ribonucleoside-diphosphate reductase, adenosylcobalamin-dependent [Mariprofundaceae bacterium]